MFDFNNKKVLVTGGTGGIGSSLVDSFLASGAEVHTNYRSAEKRLERNGLHYHHLPTIDLSSKESGSTWDVFFKSISSLEFNVVVNNLGVNLVNHIADLQEQEFRNVLEANLIFSVEVMRRVGAKMSHGDKIINISSVSGQLGKSGRLSYCTSKHGLEGATKAAALDLAHMGVLINSVSPGLIRTPMTEQNLTEEKIKFYKDRIPLGRIGTPSEVSSLVLFLCSDLNSYITGQNFIIDGGMTCGW